ncbi:hypothetical protein EDS67_29870 [candidate division KSB1 bacterium]|nr:MAG: hypothetical protein EDS67_29870 [candidate division KSB1 bacterium]MCE7941965.1 hypothetical protein [Chlorobi bacterium CHB1]
MHIRVHPWLIVFLGHGLTRIYTDDEPLRLNLATLSNQFLGRLGLKWIIQKIRAHLCSSVADCFFSHGLTRINALAL